MSKRNYNVFFHTHTVSGIVISVALYIIFFAGAFALIKDEITAWEKGSTIETLAPKDINFDKLIKSIEAEGHTLYGRDIRIIPPDAKKEIYVQLTDSQDTTIVNVPNKPTYFYADQESYKISEYYSFYSVGELLYRLHFFHQLPTIGIYIAGFVAFFFLFAIVTGVIVHWKKMVSNFFIFRPKTKLKTIWTDAHTALGVIGLPFQFIYTVTSCFLCMSIFVLLPANYVYNNNQEKLLEDIRPMMKTYPLEEKMDTVLDVNSFMAKADKKWENFTAQQIYIKNYGASNMMFQVDGLLGSKEKFLGNGRVVYKMATNTIESEKSPYVNSYVEDVELTIRKLHFGDFGGMYLKVVYFILALITCFVIISGVLIWLEARNKKNISAAKQLYNRRVGHVYLAICLSMFPITALSFIASKLIPRDLDASRQTILYVVFFVGWLLLTIYFKSKRDNYITNKYSLLWGSILGLLIPIVNGLVSGNWFWKTFANNQLDVFAIDAFWLVLASVALAVYFKIERKVPKVSHAKLVAEYQKTVLDQRKEQENHQEVEENQSKKIKFMRTKISIFWLLIVVGFILHHVYGLFGVYYNESLMIEGATGDVPVDHHLYRIFFEGIAMLFCIATLEISKQWFRLTSIIWAILLGIFNIYHFITAIAYEASNISEILILVLMGVVSVLLVKTLLQWRKEIA